MARRMVQSKKSEGYKLVIPAIPTINLLEEDEISKYTRDKIVACILKQAEIFQEREGYIPTTISVSGSVKALVRQYLKTDEGMDVGELRQPDGNVYCDMEPYLFARFYGDCHNGKNLTVAIHISSNCKVESKSSIKLTYSDDEEDDEEDE